jgi:endonuclease YncB( thermonuclease family)
VLRRLLVVLVLLGLVLALAWAIGAGWNPVPSTPSSPAEPAGPGATGIPAGAQQATVEYVHDGDTIFLDDGRKVRLLGINTPEIGENAQCGGDEATSALRALLPEGTPVWVLADTEPLDQYGRSLLWVFLPDGTNVNLELVRGGFAGVEQYAPNWLYRDELGAAEESARSSSAGLWAACGSVG